MAHAIKKIKETPGLKRTRGLLSHVRTSIDRTLFLDIETTGLSRHYHRITVIGFTLAGRYTALVAGDDIEIFQRAADKADTVVTFNGSQFDIPFMLKEHPNLRMPARHIDLRYACRYAGLTGGQKKIEVELGIERDNDISGAEAVLLWHRYVAEELEALEDLIEYNYLDVSGMATLMDHVDDKLSLENQLFPPANFAQRTLDLDKRYLLDYSSAAERGFRPLRFEELFGGTPAQTATVVGLDLTGSEKRPSGAAVSRGRNIETTTLSTDSEILEYARSANPDIVSIDSPIINTSGPYLCIR